MIVSDTPRKLWIVHWTTFGIGVAGVVTLLLARGHYTGTERRLFIDRWSKHVDRVDLLLVEPCVVNTLPQDLDPYSEYASESEASPVNSNLFLLELQLSFPKAWTVCNKSTQKEL